MSLMPLSPDERELLSLFRQLSAREQQLMADLLEEMLVAARAKAKAKARKAKARQGGKGAPQA